MDTIGDRLSQAIEGRGTTQRKLAGKVGLSQAYLSKIVAGKVPRDVILRACAHALMVDFDWLKTGEGAMVVPMRVSEGEVGDPELHHLMAQVDQAPDDAKLKIKTMIRGALAMLSMLMALHGSAALAAQAGEDESRHNVSTRRRKKRNYSQNSEELDPLAA